MMCFYGFSGRSPNVRFAWSGSGFRQSLHAKGVRASTRPQMHSIHDNLFIKYKNKSNPLRIFKLRNLKSNTRAFFIEVFSEIISE